MIPASWAASSASRTGSMSSTTSSAGSAWNMADLRGLTDITAVTTGPDAYVIFGQRHGRIELWTSSDGTTWLRRDRPDNAFPADYAIHDLVWTGSDYLAVGAGTAHPGTSTDPVAWKSNDLTEWEPIDLPCGGRVVAHRVATREAQIVVAGRCDGAGGTWTSDRSAAFTWHPAPFPDIRDLVPTGDRWYARSDEDIWVSDDAASWVATRAPVQASGIAAKGDTLYLVADAHGTAGELWSKTGDDAWTPSGASLSLGKDIYWGGTIITGPAGILASWHMGHWPSAHAAQSPVVLDRGEVVVRLYRPEEMPIAVVITDAEGDDLLSIDFPEPGEGLPDHVEIDSATGTVRLLDPTENTVLAELSFDEIETALPTRRTTPAHLVVIQWSFVD